MLLFILLHFRVNAVTCLPSEVKYVLLLLYCHLTDKGRSCLVATSRMGSRSLRLGN